MQAARIRRHQLNLLLRKLSMATHSQGAKSEHALKSSPYNSARKVTALNHLVSVFHYRGPVTELITRWKYRGMIELTDYIATQMLDSKASLPPYDLVTIIPCHWQRRLVRGFDHMWLLANALADRGIVDRPVPLIKQSRNLGFQHLKPQSERHISPLQFQVKRPLKPTRIILIDDVVTTGSTLNAAAAALKTAGASTVTGLTIASAISEPTAHV